MALVLISSSVRQPDAAYERQTGRPHLGIYVMLASDALNKR
ncbi:MAG: hypothetical protein ACR2L1_11275 [Pyrinomonadaceae bacterium]